MSPGMLTTGGGALTGLMNPGTGAWIASGVLAVPAVNGTFNPNAPDWMKAYGKGYMIAGAIGNLAHAGAQFALHAHFGELTFGVRDPSAPWGVRVTNYDLIWDAIGAGFVGAAALPLVPTFGEN